MDGTVNGASSAYFDKGSNVTITSKTKPNDSISGWQGQTAEVDGNIRYQTQTKYTYKNGVTKTLSNLSAPQTVTMGYNTTSTQINRQRYTLDHYDWETLWNDNAWAENVAFGSESDPNNTNKLRTVIDCHFQDGVYKYSFALTRPYGRQFTGSNGIESLVLHDTNGRKPDLYAIRNYQLQPGAALYAEEVRYSDTPENGEHYDPRIKRFISYEGNFSGYNQVIYITDAPVLAWKSIYNMTRFPVYAWKAV